MTPTNPMNYKIKFINHEGKRETLCTTSDLHILAAGLSSTFPGAECWVKGDSGTWRHVFTEGKEGIAGDAPDHFAEYIHLMLEVKEAGSMAARLHRRQRRHRGGRSRSLCRIHPSDARSERSRKHGSHIPKAAKR